MEKDIHIIGSVSSNTKTVAVYVDNIELFDMIVPNEFLNEFLNYEDGLYACRLEEDMDIIIAVKSGT